MTHQVQRGHVPLLLGQKMPSYDSRGGQAVNLCSTRCEAVSGSPQCHFFLFSFSYFNFVFLYFVFLKSKSLPDHMCGSPFFVFLLSLFLLYFELLYFVFFKGDHMWSCVWITTVSVEIWRDHFHTLPPSVTKPAQDVSSIHVLVDWEKLHNENIEDDEMLLKATMLIVYRGGSVVAKTAR